MLGSAFTGEAENIPGLYLSEFICELIKLLLSFYILIPVKLF